MTRTTRATPTRGTTRMRPFTRQPAAVAVLAGATALLGGCGVDREVVGLHEAPPEITTAAPLSQSGAQSIAERVLNAAEAARLAKGREGDKQRSAVMTGSALAMATAASKLPQAGPPTDEPVQKPTPPTVLAVSRGRSWPRAMFVETTDTDSSQALSLLICQDANSEFKLAASATMQPGAMVPALDGFAAGSGFNPDTKGLVGEPAALLTEYAGALAFPKPATPAHVDLADDQFATVLRRNAAAQAKALGSLAAFTQRHAVDAKALFSFRLRTGGVVVFGLMKRSDVLKLKPKGKALAPSKELAALLKKTKLTKGATVSTYESVVFTVPTQGKAVVAAVDEQLITAAGS